jgi:hypothetical protein
MPRSGEDQIPYRAMTSSLSQAFDTEPSLYGEDGSGEVHITYRAVTLFLRVSGFSMPGLVKTRSRIGP